MTTNATAPADDWNLDELREALLGRAIADPESFVDVVIQVAKRHPGLQREIGRGLLGSDTTRRQNVSPKPQPTPDQIAAVRMTLNVIRAGQEAVYDKPLSVSGTAVSMDAEEGCEVVILAGTVVSLAGVAALIRPGHVDEDLDVVSEAIANQYGGPLTQKSLTRRAMRITPAKKASQSDGAQDLPEQVVLIVQANWTEASNHIRERNEEPLSYAKRLFALCGEAVKTSVGESQRTAVEALELVRTAIPVTAQW